MSNPQRMAQDVADYYLQQLNPHESHASNIRQYLRHPVLAVTRRILLDPTTSTKAAANGTNGDDATAGLPGGLELEGAERLGETVDLNQFTIEERRMGLDWIEYLPQPKPSAASNVKGAIVACPSMESETDYTETEASDIGGGGASRMSQRTHKAGNNKSKRRLKLDRRSLARMEAFLANSALALPNEAVPIKHHFTKATTVPPAKDSERTTPTKKQLPPPKSTPLTLQSLKEALQVPPNSKNKVVSSLANAISNLKQRGGVPQSSTSSASSNLEQQQQQQRHIATFPQIHGEDLIHRLTVYIKSLRRVYLNSIHAKINNSTANDTTVRSTSATQTPPPKDYICLLAHEPPRALQTRIQILLNSFVSTTDTISAMRPTLTQLLTYTTLELLSVEQLSEDVVSTIRKIVLEYEHLTSFASLAFLSSPQESTEVHLAPLLRKYVDFLSGEWKRLVESCQLESQLSRCLDPSVRSLFKTMEFRSIGHLLEVCHDHRADLENIVIRNSRITPTRYVLDDPKALKQAMRDLRREVIIVNGHVLPPIHSLKELVALLKETLNSRPLKLKEKRIGQLSKRSMKGFRHVENGGAISESPSSESDIVTSSSETDFVSSGNEGDTDGSMHVSEGRNRVQRSSSTGSSDDDAKNCKSPAMKSSSASRRRTNNVNAIDIMTRRLLMAACRTGVGGDAYFIVRDLFGGEGVEVVHSNQNSHLGNHKRIGTIELIVRLASITIKCHSKFDVYPQSLMGDCEPLIQLYTTTTEKIELQEIRANDESVETDVSDVDQQKRTTVLMLKEKRSELTGRRYLSIRPARYEKVEEWHTPS